MIRRVYLIRHAMPDIPLGERWCIGGRTDLPLGRLGRLQAALLPFVPELQTVQAVFCSRLIRARETALPLCPAPTAVDGVEEQDMGVWDGLSFRQIQKRFPTLYALREADPSLLPEGAESMEQVARRMTDGIWSCLRQSKGDLALVSHKSAIASITGHRNSLGYTTISVLCQEGDTLRTEEIGLRPHPPLDDRVCGALLQAAGADAALQAHCRAVAALADRMCAKLQKAGLSLDARAVHRAALLHDLAKGEADHAALGGLWLEELGYPDLAPLIRQHLDLNCLTPDEAAVVFLADKAVQGDRYVDLDARFSASRGKCRTAEALAAHQKRRDTAVFLHNEMNRLCQSEIFAQEEAL